MAQTCPECCSTVLKTPCLFVFPLCSVVVGMGMVPTFLPYGFVWLNSCKTLVGFAYLGGPPSQRRATSCNVIFLPLDLTRFLTMCTSVLTSSSQIQAALTNTNHCNGCRFLHFIQGELPPLFSFLFFFLLSFHPLFCILPCSMSV